MNFELTNEDIVKVSKWKKKQDKRAGTNYYGAIGGVLTYSFTPTSLGCVIVVEHGVTKVKLDLTNYDW